MRSTGHAWSYKAWCSAVISCFFNSSDWCISILTVHSVICSLGGDHNTRHKPLWNEVKFIDRDPFYYTRRVKEAIHTRLHPNNINRDTGIEIPEAWIPTIKKHNNRRAVRQRTAEGANHWVNSKDRNAPIRAAEKTTNHSRASYYIRSRMTSQPYRLKKTNSMQSKRRDLKNLAFINFIVLTILWKAVKTTDCI